jgi:hypothetical protein
LRGHAPRWRIAGYLDRGPKMALHLCTVSRLDKLKNH